jgi:hypothetical protein
MIKPMDMTAFSLPGPLSLVQDTQIAAFLPIHTIDLMRVT